jgi:hypothetical protein
VQGLTGAAGAGGAAGKDGAAGAAGAKGAAGTAGAAGVAGTAGAKGEAGADGAAGAMGVKGETGSTGSTGAQGPAGVGSTAGVTLKTFIAYSGDCCNNGYYGSNQCTISYDGTDSPTGTCECPAGSTAASTTLDSYGWQRAGGDNAGAHVSWTKTETTCIST